MDLQPGDRVPMPDGRDLEVARTSGYAQFVALDFTDGSRWEGGAAVQVESLARRIAERSKAATWAGDKFNCPKGTCDQRRPCVHYCWWNPHRRALATEADAYRERRDA